MKDTYKSPYVYFGGKSKIAAEVWQRFGQCDRYIEPFLGSGAVLLANPYWRETKEIVNDLNHYIANCWRAIRNAPDEVAYWCDYPCIEIELHLWHIWLVNEGKERIAACEWDENHYDAEVAGKWLYGMANWIGAHFAVGNNGGWTRERLKVGQEYGYDLSAVKREHEKEEISVNRKRPHLSSGRGVNRKRPHLNNGQGVNRQRPHLSSNGQGVNRQLSHLSDGREFLHEFFPKNVGLYDYIRQLSERFIEVDVCCGDWLRIVQPAVTHAGKESTSNGSAAIFFDPPYSIEANRSSVYSVEDFSVAHAVRTWCIEQTDNPKMRIALAGYDVEHKELEDHGWTTLKWSAHGGYSVFADKGNQSHLNKHREVVWFSPSCIGSNEMPLFGDLI